MATKFQADITNSISPSMADPSAAIRGAQQKGEALAGALTFAGGTVWDAYTGKQFADFAHAQEGEVASLQQAMRDIKGADIVNKAVFADNPEEPGEVAAFRNRQAAIAEARDAFPNRYKEFMLRSETLLKEYIARFPGLADKFKGVSADIIGKRGVDLYSVQNLYDEVGFIEQQKRDMAKAAAQADAEGLKRFVADMAPTLGQTGAADLYNRTDPQMRVQMVLGAKQGEQAKAQLDSDIKAGGQNLLNTANHVRLQFEGNIAKASIKIFDDLSKLGVSRADLAAGNISDDAMAKPEFKTLANQHTSALLTGIDEAYAHGLAQLSSLSTTPADAEMRRKAVDDLKNWYKDTREYYSKAGPMAALTALAGDDPEKVFSTRLSQIQSFVAGFNAPPDLAAAFSAGPGTVQWDVVRERYPTSWAPKFAFVERLRRAATQGVSTKDWMEVVKSYNDVRANPEGTDIGANGVDATTGVGRMLALTGAVEQLRAVSLGSAPVESIRDELPNIVSHGSSEGGNIEFFVQRALPNFKNVVSKLPASEQKVVLDASKQRLITRVEGLDGHGDLAKTVFTKFKEDPFFKLRGSAVFASPDGTGPLAMQIDPRALRSKPDPNSPLALDMRDASKGVNYRPLRDTNTRLKLVDDTLRMRAMITGEDVATLRKEFVALFSAAAPTVSAARSMQLSTDGGEVPTGPSASPTDSNAILNSLKALED